jgi:hypothetical protein
MANPRSDERHTAQASQEAVQAAREAARKSSEEAERIAQSAAEMNSQATRTGADILARNVETTQQVLQSGAEMAAKLTQHFGRSLGLTEDSGQTTQVYARTLSAILQSTAVLAEMTQGITRELMDLGRSHLEQNLDRFDRMLHSRGPQDFLAVQSEMVRNNLEGFLGCSRRLAERSMRTTEDLARRFNDTAEQNRRAA